MSKITKPTEECNELELTELCLKGHLADRWADRFDGMTVTLTETGNTILTDPVVDQAALYGLLRKVRDLGLVLISVHWVEPDKYTRWSHSSLNYTKAGLFLPKSFGGFGYFPWDIWSSSQATFPKLSVSC